MVKRRRAEVEVSTLSAEQRRELAEAKDKKTQYIWSSILKLKRHRVKGSHRLR